MFTQLVTGILGELGSVPAVLVYVIVAIWIGVDVAGIPLPMEPVLLFVGALGADGRSSIVLAVGSAVLGSMAFASVAYHLGRWYGKPAVTRYGRRLGFSEERADHMELWLRKRGVAGVLIACVSPVIRTFSAYVMGIAEVPVIVCALGVFIGTLLYSTTWIVIGRALGANYRAPLHYVDRLGLYGFVILVVVLGAVIAAHRFWGEASVRRVAAHFHHHQRQAAPAVLAVGDASELTSQATGQTLASALVTQPASSETREMASAAAVRIATTPPVPPTPPTPATPTTGTSAARSTVTRAPWPRALWVILLCLWVTGAILLTVMSGAAHTYAEFPPDPGISAWVQHLRGTPFAEPVKLAGDLQWFQPTGIALALIFGTLLAFRLFFEAVFLALAAFGTDLVNVILNTIVSRPRPHGVRITTLVSTFGQASFPSGHVAHAVGLYGFVFFLCLLGIRARPKWKWALIAVQVICVYFILFVGPSRVLEGQHWPSDVAAGYLVGALMLTVAITLYHLVPRRWPFARANLIRSPRQAAVS